uniref:Secreted RxLR effector protein 154 n=1 Tax=Plasmopara viticola TaxID=143451 RepID=RL154_PLAVT|nr:RecName: Full=Secreted RxLR effector protein 154; Flags: Precursor [Plasmopara viticola]
MRRCALLFRLFLISYSCSVYFSACTQASSLKEPDEELPRAEQWDDNGKRILQADDPEHIRTEERGITQNLKPAAESIGKVKAAGKAIKTSVLNSKLMNWVKTALRKGYTAWQLVKMYSLSKGGGVSAMMSGITPLTYKTVYGRTIASKVDVKEKFDTFKTEYFKLFEDLDNVKPSSGMQYWDDELKKLPWTRQFTARLALNKVRKILKSDPSVEKMIDLNVSPLLYMRALEKQGAFARNDVAAINKLKDYVKAFKKHVDLA